MISTKSVVRDGLTNGESFDIIEDGIIIGRVDVTGVVGKRRYFDVYDAAGTLVDEGEVLEGWPASNNNVAARAWDEFGATV